MRGPSIPALLVMVRPSKSSKESLTFFEWFVSVAWGLDCRSHMEWSRACRDAPHCGCFHGGYEVCWHLSFNCLSGGAAVILFCQEHDAAAFTSFVVQAALFLVSCLASLLHSASMYVLLSAHEAEILVAMFIILTSQLRLLRYWKSWRKLGYLLTL